MAESWIVSKDGLTYTYKIRQGTKWYTSEGEEYADVTAYDFVTGLKYAADKKAENLYLVQDSIKGLADYVEGKSSDFGTVGVKAVDDYTLQYTLNRPETYWNSKTTASILNPVNEAFLNPDKAKEKFAKAKESLQAQGVTFPIHLDMPVDQTAKLDVQQAGSFKQTVEETLGKENVVIDVIQLSPDEKDQATFFADTAEQKDYDIDISGWGGDYSDPKTYLAILDPETGSQLKNMGLSEGKDKEVKDKIGLSDYKKLLDQADAEITDTQDRYEKYAEAQAWLTDSALFLPVQSGGANPIFRKTVPFTGPFSFVGNKGNADNYKYVELQKEPVTAKQYQELYEK